MKLIHEKIHIELITLIGIQLPGKTSNADEQSSIDCGNLWTRFSGENVHEKILGKVSDDVYAVYYDYEGDHRQPFRYFIGCQVNGDTVPGEGLDKLAIPGGNYMKIEAKGTIPDCITDAWRQVWNSNIARRYTFDFEVYGKASQDWNNATVPIYLS